MSYTGMYQYVYTPFFAHLKSTKVSHLYHAKDKTNLIELKVSIYSCLNKNI